jgi:hypothetical protein
MRTTIRSVSYSTLFICFLSFSACRHKYYVASYFEQQTAGHKMIAVLPAEMIFTGKQPKELSPEDISAIEERESRAFQESLVNGIFKYANTRREYMSISVQDVNTTNKLLQDHDISVRDSWTQNDKELAQILKVDAVVRMRIQKKRYMSELASYGIGVGRQIIGMIGRNNKFPTPYVPNKTNDIYAACNIVSDNKTLWNDHYEGAADWNSPPDVVINNITENFGKNFPYKRRR